MKAGLFQRRAPFFEFLLVFVVIITTCFIFLNTPIPRQIGLTARYDLVLPVAILLVCSIFILRIPGIAGQVLSAVYVSVVFSLPLSGLWASGTSEQYIVGGVLQTSDSMLYYIDALNFLEGGNVSVYSVDKPFISSLVSGLLALTHYNWINVLILITVFVALSVYLAVRELQRTHGPLAGSVFLVFLFLFIRRYSGTAMSENPGFCFGLLGFILLWRFVLPVNSDDRARLHWLVLGIGTTTLALLTRLGALFILPLLIIWGFVIVSYKPGTEKKWTSNIWKNLLWLICPVILIFICYRIVALSIAGPDAVVSSQFPIQLYSLVNGGQYWGALMADHPELSALTGNAFSMRALQVCLEAFLNNPLGIVSGVFVNLNTYFFDIGRGEYSYIDGSNDFINAVFRSVSFILAGLGILSLFFPRQQKIRSFLLVCVVGLLISVPLVPPISTFKLRLMAGSIWIQALLPALAVAWLVSWLPEKAQKFINNLPARSLVQAWAPASISAVMLLFLVLSPKIIRWTHTYTPLPNLNCPAGQKAVALRVYPGTYVELVDQYDPR